MRASILLYVGTCMFTCMYCISLYSCSHATDILHILMGISVAYVTNHVLFCGMRPHFVSQINVLLLEEKKRHSARSRVELEFIIRRKAIVLEMEISRPNKKLWLLYHRGRSHIR